jgi:nucleoside-diphosphate-sugar epimerase
MLRLALAETSGVVNLSSGRLISVRRFVETAAAQLGIDQSLLHFGSAPGSEWDMQIEAISTERVERLLGWLPPTPVEEGIRLTAAACAAVPCS